MMLRRLATVVLMLAVTLIGLPPVGAPTAVAAIMTAEGPCCHDCEQGEPQADRDCAGRPDCAFPCAAAASSLPARELALMPRSVGQSLEPRPHDRAVVPEPTSPPYRPPRPSILV